MRLPPSRPSPGRRIAGRTSLGARAVLQGPGFLRAAAPLHTAASFLAWVAFCVLLAPLPVAAQDRAARPPPARTPLPAGVGAAMGSDLPTSTWLAESAPRVPLRRSREGSDAAGPSRTPGVLLPLPGSRQESRPTGGEPGPATSFVASLVAPGSSQWMHGQRRTYLYLGLEIAGWIGFLHGRHEGADAREAYRDLAWTHAAVGADPNGFTGGFSFYETLGQWTTSGAWDADPTTEGLQPETDPETYNGSIWGLASELYLSGEGSGSDPDAMRSALLYYRERAYPPEQAWDWSGNSFQLDRYRDLIERSDDSFRRATVILGAVVANHLLSAVDGFLSTRISSERSVRLSSDARPFGRSRAMRWTFELSLNPFP